MEIRRYGDEAATSTHARGPWNIPSVTANALAQVITGEQASPAVARPNDTGGEPLRFDALERARVLTRREALRVGAAATAAFLGACRTAAHADAPSAGPGRLRQRPGRPTAPAPAGLGPLGLASGRDGLLFVPSGYSAASPAPLVLMLHGAGRASNEAMEPFLTVADSAGLVVLAPDSRGRTWDFLYGPYGADVAFIDLALEHVFRRCAIDPARLGIAGFSDGASYALSLGLTNGDLFSRVVAFSPCILAPAAYVGHPRIFISHGADDRVLPVDRCGRVLAERLRGKGYDVLYREFAGPHTVPRAILQEALAWMST